MEIKSFMERNLNMAHRKPQDLLESEINITDKLAAKYHDRSSVWNAYLPVVARMDYGVNLRLADPCIQYFADLAVTGMPMTYAIMTAIRNGHLAEANVYPRPNHRRGIPGDLVFVPASSGLYHNVFNHIGGSQPAELYHDILGYVPTAGLPKAMTSHLDGQGMYLFLPERHLTGYRHGFRSQLYGRMTGMDMAQELYRCLYRIGNRLAQATDRDVEVLMLQVNGKTSINNPIRYLEDIPDNVFRAMAISREHDMGKFRMLGMQIGVDVVRNVYGRIVDNVPSQLEDGSRITKAEIERLKDMVNACR